MRALTDSEILRLILKAFAYFEANPAEYYPLSYAGYLPESGEVVILHPGPHVRFFFQAPRPDLIRCSFDGYLIASGIRASGDLNRAMELLGFRGRSWALLWKIGEANVPGEKFPLAYAGSRVKAWRMFRNRFPALTSMARHYRYTPVSCS